MARAFVRASSQGLEHGAAVIGAYPLTLAAWVRSDDATVGQSILGVFNATVDRWIRIELRGDIGGDPARIEAYDGVTNANAATSSGYSANTWHHVCGVSASSTSRIVYLDGGNSGSDTTALLFPAEDRTAIGKRLMFGGDDFFFSGRIAEAAIWSAALDAAEVAALAKGFSPLLIRPTSLAAYWPLLGNDASELDRWKSRFDMTVTVATKADHIRIYYPWQAP